MDFGMPNLIEAPTLQESTELCSELGLKFVELNMNFPQTGCGSVSSDEINAMKEKYGVYYTIHLDERVDVCDFNTLISEAYMETVRRTITLAKEIGAPVINMHLSTGIHITLPTRKEYLYKTYREHYLGSLKRFRDEAEKLCEGKVTICVENTDGWQEHEKEAIKMLLESPCFALTWDLGHDRSARKGDCDWLLENKVRLKHMHVHDGDDTHCHLALGDGDIDIAARLETAKECGCRCVLETKTIDALRSSVAYLKNTEVL